MNEGINIVAHIVARAEGELFAVENREDIILGMLHAIKHIDIKEKEAPLDVENTLTMLKTCVEGLRGQLPFQQIPDEYEN